MLDMSTGSPPRASRPVLELRDIAKSFSGARALDGAQLSLVHGEVHVLFGENGAGKSTLINIISGVFRPDAGEIAIEGKPVSFANVKEARVHGIGAMFQEFSLAPHLTVEENIWLGNERLRAGVLDKATMRAKAREILTEYGFDIAPTALVQDLPRAGQQMVEMAKVMLLEPCILILDEPTASLSEAETQRLFETIAQLKARGVAIIYITHRMREIDAIADRITIMRDGRYITTVDAKATGHSQLVELMTGRKVGNLYPALAPVSGPEILKIEGLCAQEGGLRDISFSIRAGEIVGLAGLVGCGKSEIGRAVFGLLPATSGQITLEGARIAQPRTSEMLRKGVAYISSDRRSEGLFAQRPTFENLTFTSLLNAPYAARGILRLRAERKRADQLAREIELRPLTLDAEVANYSGGNQQKIVLARALAITPRLLILDEPTVGVDVGAREQIYRTITALAAEGCAVLLISSDMPEIINLCHRAYAVSGGILRDEMQQTEITEERLLRAFFVDTTEQPQ